MKQIFSKIIILILLQTISINIFGQKLSYPLKNMVLANNFCEFRKNHFHSGIDLRSHRGTPVYAIADGYVSRLKINPYGYGRVVYITHYNNLKSVYAHLNGFAKNIEEYFYAIQKNSQTYSIDINLDSGKIPVKKGQIIGYVGNSGRSFGPHLHFEIRTSNDEPLNPQLFYRFGDNIPPFATTVGIYPANRHASINGLANSRIFPVKSNTIASIPVVHGKIFFGIEAYDRVNNVANKHSVYSTKLFIDDTLIYFSQFDTLSFDNVRDINSMIDYLRRLTTGHRIQTTRKTPANELKHYRYLKNNGIYNFNDNKTHTIQFIIADINGNKTAVKFRVKSTKTSPKHTEKQENTQKITWTKEYRISRPGIEIYFPEKSVFDTLNFFINSSAGNQFAPMYHIGNEYIPLKNYILVSINTATVPKRLKNKLIACHITPAGKKKYITGTVNHSFFNFWTRELGKYLVETDTTAPTLRPVKKSNYRKFIIKDDKSGINSYAGFIDGKWQLMAYDPKNNLLQFEKMPAKFKKISIFVRDNTGNTKIYSFTH